MVRKFAKIVEEVSIGGELENGTKGLFVETRLR